jgi:hypothetical protein
MVICEICGEGYKTLKGVIKHAGSKHSLNNKEYYDKYLKNDGEGICLICSGETTFRNTSIGYLNHCSTECVSKNKTIKRCYWAGKKQSDSHIKKRIDNTDQNIKQKNLEKSNLEKYGVKNISSLDSTKDAVRKKSKGSKKPRTSEWQKKIIESKRRNGTIKHTQKTKEKISEILNIYYSKNTDRVKFIGKNNNINHLSGWYRGLYFRSSLELSFLVNNSEQTFTSCETKDFSVIYEVNSKIKVYYPDFTDGVFIYEIKPSSLLNIFNNDIKIKEAKILETVREKIKI